MNDLLQWFRSYSWRELVLPVVVFAASAAVSIGISIAVLVRLPQDHFVRTPKVDGASPRGALTWLGRNLSGLVLVLLGVVLSLPGVPGQGLLLMFVGLVVMDLPFTRRAERWALGRPLLRRSVDRIRKRYGKEPFELDVPVRVDESNPPESPTSFDESSS